MEMRLVLSRLQVPIMDKYHVMSGAAETPGPAKHHFIPDICSQSTRNPGQAADQLKNTFQV
jgi:hypothetical protein